MNPVNSLLLACLGGICFAACRTDAAEPSKSEWSKSDSTNLFAKTQWVVETNWTSAAEPTGSFYTLPYYYGDSWTDHGYTRIEHATIRSNLIATLETGQMVTLRSIDVGSLTRTWHWTKPVKEYTPEVFSPPSPIVTNTYATNSLFVISGSISNIVLTNWGVKMVPEDMNVAFTNEIPTREQVKQWIKEAMKEEKAR